jgi:hypothetical protein
MTQELKCELSDTEPFPVKNEEKGEQEDKIDGHHGKKEYELAFQGLRSYPARAGNPEYVRSGPLRAVHVIQDCETHGRK